MNIIPLWKLFGQGLNVEATKPQTHNLGVMNIIRSNKTIEITTYNLLTLPSPFHRQKGPESIAQHSLLRDNYYYIPCHPRTNKSNSQSHQPCSPSLHSHHFSLQTFVGRDPNLVTPNNKAFQAYQTRAVNEHVITVRSLPFLPIDEVKHSFPH